MKKHKLSSSEAPIFCAYGIVSADKDYRLCFKLNKALGLNLTKTGSLRHMSESGGDPLLCHHYNDKVSGLNYYLIRNRQENFFIAPQFKMADYLLIVEMPDVLKDCENSFKESIQKMANIQSIFVIPYQQLKSINLD